MGCRGSLRITGNRLMARAPEMPLRARAFSLWVKLPFSRLIRAEACMASWPRSSAAWAAKRPLIRYPLALGKNRTILAQGQGISDQRPLCSPGGAGPRPGRHAGFGPDQS